MDDSLEGLVSKVEALHLDDDQVLVLSTDRVLSGYALEKIRNQMDNLFPNRKSIVLDGGMRLDSLGQHRQLQRIEQTLAGVAAALQAVLQLLSDGEEPAESRTLDGDLFSTRERDQSQPL